jgi:hypothetical protein
MIAVSFTTPFTYNVPVTPLPQPGFDLLTCHVTMRSPARSLIHRRIVQCSWPGALFVPLGCVLSRPSSVQGPDAAALRSHIVPVQWFPEGLTAPPPGPAEFVNARKSLTPYTPFPSVEKL